MCMDVSRSRQCMDGRLEDERKESANLGAGRGLLGLHATGGSARSAIVDRGREDRSVSVRPEERELPEAERHDVAAAPETDTRDEHDLPRPGPARSLLTRDVDEAVHFECSRKNCVRVFPVHTGPIARRASGGGSFPRLYHCATVARRSPIRAAISAMP